MKIDRRRFLVGAGGSVLALPFLESLWHRRAAAQDMTPPKRFVLLFHAHGLVRTRWMPASTGALPATGDLSDVLAPLNAIRDRVVVLSGLGNPARHVVAGDNHRRTNTTILTNTRPVDDSIAGGESIDQAVARLISGTAVRSSVLLPLSPTSWGPSRVFFSQSGSVVSPVSSFSWNPREAAESLFGSLPTGGEPPPTPSLAERLRSRRGTLLDGVRGELSSLRARVSAPDRERLDAHAAHLEALARRYGGGGGMPTISCERPDFTTIPSLMDDAGLEGRQDDVSAPAQIDNLVRALACDITRVGALDFNAAQSPGFPWLFGGDPAGAWQGFVDWHDMIHLGQPTGDDSDRGVPNLIAGQRFYAEQFTYLVQQLAASPDIDGTSSLLDNTLVMWASDFGNENHGTHNIPVVLAGMGSTLVPGRHLSVTGYSMGDLYATVLHLLGAPDGTGFGLSGPIDWATMEDTWAYNGPAPELFQRGLLPL